MIVLDEVHCCHAIMYWDYKSHKNGLRSNNNLAVKLRKDQCALFLHLRKQNHISYEILQNMCWMCPGGMSNTDSSWGQNTFPSWEHLLFLHLVETICSEMLEAINLTHWCGCLSHCNECSLLFWSKDLLYSQTRIRMTNKWESWNSLKRIQR